MSRETNPSATVTRRLFSTGLIVATGTLSVPAWAQGSGEAPARSASEMLRALRETLPIPAISAAIVRGGDLIWVEAQGLADIELNLAARPEHMFRLGSVSKVVTAAVGARLAQAGIIDLDAPVSTYRPDLPEQHRATTLRQLYSHQGGVRHYQGKDFDIMAPGGVIDRRFYETTEDALALFIDDPLVAEPGTTANYSTFGYTLISAVLESASGMAFTDLIAREIAAPLSLAEFGADKPFDIIPGRVSPYDPPEMYQNVLPVPLPDLPVLNAVAINPAYKWAGGGVVSSARDLARFGAAHLGGDYLGEGTRTMMFTPAVQATPDMTLGLGWRIDTAEGLGRRFHHAGNIQGGRAQLALYPDHGLAVALMSNLGGTPPDIARYADQIALAFSR